MGIYFSLKCIKINKIFLKISKNRKYDNIFIFEDRIQNFDSLQLNHGLIYQMSGMVINWFENKQILSVSKIIPLCENNFGDDETYIPNLMGEKN